jgi:hypothetical protein
VAASERTPSRRSRPCSVGTVVLVAVLFVTPLS